MNYNYQIIKSIIVNLENSVLTHELEKVYNNPISWNKAVYRLCRKNFEKIERKRMTYDKFKIKNNIYFKESEKGKWNRKINTLASANLDIVNETKEERIQLMILKLERIRMHVSKQKQKTFPLSRLIENFNRRRTVVIRDEWDIPIIHLVKKMNWRN
ncbi:hypothetical protein ND861_04935 [Leptospira sp. 2 VSF19]|uniref:Transposase n=1 Tax=Leptospira soteropolitanensis TaxID=2950025 RepID=A0AAW5VFZ7_9LEPT|nr:hypothetical protein [Leptospira soteropolitanensis]MCW7491996.1 hypothetical protein [Leptospira soteropolitanensis]MCW7499579.1 hypothetical protein [Leptospira soteropolitanensis]MCW7521830.1 hypothetical protein [Leptospira soteropolitanensis]MCW7525683.1 hypothetical protein [Leptospira soteropolitanensis]MCW7530202.1 hypothetical protein [Leptospira soteropolitanensis]